MWNDKSLSHLLYFPNFCSVIGRQHLCHLKTPCCDSWDIQGQSLSRGFKAFSCTTPFARSWCSHLLGNFLVACICAWHHFLWVRLLCSNYNIGCQNFERVLCLILPSSLVESVLFAILHCQSYLQECVSRRGLLHNMRDQYLSWGSTAALNCFLTQKSVSRMTRGRSRKKYRTLRKSTDENDHSQSGQGEEIATPPAWRTSPRRGIEMNSSNPL